MNDSAAAWVELTGLWAMLGLKEIVIVGFVTLLLYGRTGLRHTHHARTVWSWMMPRRVARPVRRAPPREPESFWALASWARGERLFWALAFVAATAVAAWIITRTVIVSAPGPTR